MSGEARQAIEMNNKKTEPKKKPEVSANSASSTEDIIKENFSGELNEPRWSVISFEKLIAGNLTYLQATDKLNELNAEKVSGLCIITDEAARRISSK